MNIRSMHFDPMSSKAWIRFVRNNEFSSEELAWIYCYGLAWDALLTDPENMPFVTKTFLDCGMNPNQLVTKKEPDKKEKDTLFNIPLIAVTHIDNDAAAVESLSILLERGGDPNTVHEFGDFTENVFEFYVEDEFVHGPDLDGRSFYGLLLCWAYGGEQQSGYKPFEMLVDEPVSILKDYKRFWYEYAKDSECSSRLYVIEKETGRKVANYH